MKFKKKDPTVEAILYDNLNKEEIERFAGTKAESEIYDAAWQAGVAPPIRVLYLILNNKKIQLNPNEYLIKDESGSFSTVKKELFEQNYELDKSTIIANIVEDYMDKTYNETNKFDNVTYCHAKNVIEWLDNKYNFIEKIQ